jgi:MFS family permease
VITAAVIGISGGVAFVLVERRTTHPLVRLDMFRNKVFAATNVVTVFIYAALSVFFFLLVLQLQLVSGWSPLAAGTSMLPVTVVMLLLSARFGALSQRTGPRPLMTLGSVLAAAGLVLALRIGPDASYLGDVLPAVVVLGLGLACAVAPLTAAVLGAAPVHLAGAASGINNATARSAGLLAIAVVPTVAGLSSAGLSDAATFARGYGIAMMISIGLLLSAAALSWWGIGRTPDASEVDISPDTERVPVHLVAHCPISSPALHPVQQFHH